jgi:hypothetical protein
MEQVSPWPGAPARPLQRSCPRGTGFQPDRGHRHGLRGTVGPSKEVGRAVRNRPGLRGNRRAMTQSSERPGAGPPGPGHPNPDPGSRPTRERTRAPQGHSAQTGKPPETVFASPHRRRSDGVGPFPVASGGAGTGPLLWPQGRKRPCGPSSPGMPAPPGLRPNLGAPPRPTRTKKNSAGRIPSWPVTSARSRKPGGFSLSVRLLPIISWIPPDGGWHKKAGRKSSTRHERVCPRLAGAGWSGHRSYMPGRDAGETEAV